MLALAVMRQGSHREGGSARVSALTSTIKSDVLRLTKTLDTMEHAAAESRRSASSSGGMWGSQPAGSPGKAEAAHSEAVVGNLKHSLLGATQGLQSLLSTQTTELQAAAVRRGRIGLRPPAAVAAPAAPGGAASASSSRRRSTDPSDGMGASAPRLGAAAGDGGVDDEFGAVDVEALGPSAAAVAQAEARSREMQEVERSTAEVAELFKRLTGILGSQSERIHGVEATIDGSLRSLEQGESHLERANATAGSSVLLAMQVSAVLLLALIGFLLLG